MRRSERKKPSTKILERLENRRVLSVDTVTFNFENLPIQVLSAPLTLTQSGLSIDVSRSGSTYVVMPIEGVGSMGTRALSPSFTSSVSGIDFIEGDATPFVVNFSRQIKSLSAEMGDFGSDSPDILTVSLYSGLNGTGTKVGHASVPLPHTGQYSFTSVVVNATAPAARSAIIIGGTGKYPNSTYIDNLTATLTTPPPSTGAAAGRVTLVQSSSTSNDKNAPGIEGIIIYADANRNGFRDPNELTATSKSDGSYVLEGLSPGQVTIGYADRDGRRPVLPASGTQRVTIKAGEQSTQVNFSLREENPLRILSTSPAMAGRDGRSMDAITITFNSEVDPATRWGGVFQLRGSGGDKVFGNGNDTTYSLAATAWSARNKSLTLTIDQGWLPVDTYSFIATDELFNIDGNRLDGEFGSSFPTGNGLPGGNYTTTFAVTNVPPLARTFAGKGQQNQSTLINLSATDADGDLDSLLISKQPTNGTLTPTGKVGEFIYTPKQGFVGIDSFRFYGLDKSGGGPDAYGKISVAASPVDFTPRTITVKADGALRVGGTMTVSWTVDNQGVGTTIPDTWVDRFYLSRDAALDRDDLLIASCDVREYSISPGGTYNSGRNVELPFGEWAGDVFLICQVNALGDQLEENTANNVSAIPVRLTPSIDLLTLDGAFVGRKQPFAVKWRDAIASAATTIALGIDSDNNPSNGRGSIELVRGIAASGDGSMDTANVIVPSNLPDGSYFLWARLDTPTGRIYSKTVPIQVFENAYPGEDERKNATGGGSYEVYGVDLAESKDLITFRVRTNFSPRGDGGDLYVKVGGSDDSSSGGTVAIGLRERKNSSGQFIAAGGVYQGASFEGGFGRRGRPIFAQSYLTRSPIDATVSITATPNRPWAYEATGAIPRLAIGAKGSDVVEIGWGMYCGNDYSSTATESRPAKPEPRLNILGSGFTVRPVQDNESSEPIPSFRWGTQALVSYTVVNQGDSPANASRVSIVFSPDSTVSKNDRSLSVASGSLDVPALAVGASFTGEVEVHLPSQPPEGLNAGGRVTIGMIVDAADAIAESDETDNFNFGRGMDKAEIRIGRAKYVNVLIHGYAIPGRDTSLLLPTTAETMEARYESFGEQLLAYADTVPALKGQVDYYVTRWASDLGFSSALTDIASYRVLELLKSDTYEPDLSLINFVQDPAALRAKIKAAIEEAIKDVALAALQQMYLSDAMRSMERARSIALDAAQTTVFDLTQTLDSSGLTKLGPPEEGQWIHVIGHSRGGAVGAEVVRQLTQRGYRVALYTGLDGFSVDWPDGDKMPDLDLPAALRQGPAARMINYRVEEGLSQYADATIRDFLQRNISESIPDLKLSRFLTDDEGNPLDWRAPSRAPLLDDVMMSSKMPIGEASNHLNVTDFFFRYSPGENVNQLLATENPYRAMLNASSSWVFGGSKGLAGRSLPVARSVTNSEAAFVDGGFEGAGVMRRAIAGLKSVAATGDPIVDTLWRRMVSPSFGVDHFVHTDGTSRLVDISGNTVLEIAKASRVDLAESLPLSSKAAYLGFRLAVRQAGDGATLSVKCNGQTIGRIGLKEAPGTPFNTQWFDIRKYAGRSSRFSFVIEGPATTSVLLLDDFRILSESESLPARRASVGLIDDQVLYTNESQSITVPISVGNSSKGIKELRIQVLSDNKTILPDAGIRVVRDQSSASVVLTPRAKSSGRVGITVIVSDGSLGPDKDNFVTRCYFRLDVSSWPRYAAPEEFAVAAGAASVRLSWRGVSSPDVVDYVVQSRKRGSTEWVQENKGVSKEPYAVLREFTNGGVYSFRVFARSQSFVGKPSLSREARILPAPEHDLNGDGSADIALILASGDLAGLLFDRQAKIIGASGTLAIRGKVPLATGDFDANGFTDSIWRESGNSGITLVLRGANDAVLGSQDLNVGVSATVEGVGDFNGDGRDDLLMRDASSGQVVLYQMDGLNVSSVRFLGGSLSSRTVASSPRCDVNGDGVSDIIWRDAGGRYRVTFMGEGQQRRSMSMPSLNGLEVIDANDFDGDGLSDFLCWNPSRSRYTLRFVSPAGDFVRAVPLPFAGGDRFVSSFDMNSDGLNDILVQRSDGGCYVAISGRSGVVETLEVSMPIGARPLLRPGRVAPIVSLPSAPRDVLVRPENAAVVLSWGRPASDGGAVIAGYIVRYKAVSDASWRTLDLSSSLQTTVRVAGLVNGTAYVFKVAAVSGLGLGAESLPTAPASPRTVPLAPSFTALVGSNARVSLKWAAPISDGGAAITDYRVRYSADGGVSWSSVVSMGARLTGNVDGLVNSVSYIFQVAAVNAAGVGAFSVSSAPVVPSGQDNRPRAPSAIRATLIGENSFRLAWTDNSVNEDGFEVWVARAGAGFVLSERVPPNRSTALIEYEVRGGKRLAANTGYEVKIRAYREDGVFSDFSGTITVASADNRPGGPSSPRVTSVGERSFRVSWTDNASNEDGFEVWVARAGGGFILSERVPANGVTALIEYERRDGDRLEPNTSYQVKIRAYRDGGAYSAFTEAVSLTTADNRPNAPSAPKVSAVGEKSFRLSWTNNASNEDGFEVWVAKAGGSFTLSEPVPAKGTTALIEYEKRGGSRLEPNTSYQVKLRAFREGGVYSDFTEALSLTTADNRPVSPSRLRASAIERQSFKLSWSDNSDNEDKFQVFIRKSSSSEWYRSEDVRRNLESATIEWLRAGEERLARNTSYVVRMRSVKSDGTASAWSGELTVKTSN